MLIPNCYLPSNIAVEGDDIEVRSEEKEGCVAVGEGGAARGVCTSASRSTATSSWRLPLFDPYFIANTAAEGDDIEEAKR
jgi:hypothetical protein